RPPLLLLGFAAYNYTYTFRRPLYLIFKHHDPTDISTLSLHDALPICPAGRDRECSAPARAAARSARPADRALDRGERGLRLGTIDRKSTRLNSSHLVISYAVFCLKKKRLALQIRLPLLSVRSGEKNCQ